MATLAELRTEVRELLGDSNQDAFSWSESNVDAAINQACLNYCEKTGVTYMETVITADAQGMVTLPNPAIDVHRVFVTR